MYAPGVVAGRDTSAGGLHAGNVVYRPEWLAKFRPRPVETLRITAALGADGLRRVSPRLP
ncbi:MAG: hypothetical protein DI536_35460 [Archangium gephyra]|uniref:Uncharacterized protein n=1 Tax=Archangium gephyra TaxID=48 RepID=A0A2W5U4W1_9BACT|nr:MAG: hypothetical protein DI536_35460 [Archangium gephyra]